MGYESVTQIDSPGQFAVRGSILDIYTLTDEIDSFSKRYSLAGYILTLSIFSIERWLSISKLLIISLQQRLEFIQRILEDKPFTVIVTADAFLDKIQPLEQIKDPVT